MKVFSPEDVPEQMGSSYPAQFKPIAEQRRKRRVGDFGGLNNFGVNLVTLPPGAGSALRHWHSLQDELVTIISGELVLITDAGEQIMTPGMFAAFPAGNPDGHQLVNKSDNDAVYIEVGDRTEGDEVDYPDDDLLRRMHEGEGRFVNKQGEPY